MAYDQSTWHDSNPDADLYVLLSLESDDLWASLKLVSGDAPKSFKVREEVVVRRERPVPDGMTDWTYLHVSIESDIVAERATPRTMPRASLDLIPDTLKWFPLRIVSARLKQFLEAEFPDGGQFYPFSYRDRDTGEIAWPEIWYWMPKHYLDFGPEEWRGTDQQMVPRVWGVLGRKSTTWEMYHNTVFQEFAAGLPFWAASATFDQVAFRPDVYRRLKAEGFTGFVELGSGSVLGDRDGKSVGYVHYGK